MTKSNIKQSGMGALGIILIIAIVVVGGYALIKSTQNTNERVSELTEEEAVKKLADARADVLLTLAEVRANVEANTEEAVEEALHALTDLRTRLVDFSVEAHASVQEDIQVLESYVQSIESMIVANIDDAVHAIDMAIEEITAESSSMMEEVDTMTESEGSTGTTTEDGGGAMEADVEVEAGVEATY